MALKFAIVGSGPAGFFTAKSLLKQYPSSQIDMFEKWPVPFGLIRYGVAPDHGEIKNILTDFTHLSSSPNFRYFGNVNIGLDLTYTQLSEIYSAVIYAHGSASADKPLKIPGGEHSVSARSIVEWYNSMPNCLNFSLKGIRKVGIIGNGNVAIDVARVIASKADRLELTDISEFALEEIRSSEVEEIDIFARRGPIQAAMTVKELRFLTKVEGLSICVAQEDIDRSLTFTSEAEASLNSSQVTQQQRARKRLFDLINSLPRTHSLEARVKINLKFMLAPVEYSNKVLKLVHTHLVGEKYQQTAINSDKLVERPCDLLIRSIGYSGMKIDKDLPFDESEGTVKNFGGKVENNCYVAGWARTGPFGVIDTTMRSVFHTIDALVEDINNSKISFKTSDVADLLHGDVVCFDQWKKIDDFERYQGSLRGKEREKIKSVDKMLEVAFN